MSEFDKNEVDVSQMFLIYMATVGDVNRTAAALHIAPAVVQEMAEREGWVEKVRRVSVMSKSEKPGDYERAVNRALNFVQAHQFREMVENFLRHMRAKSTQELENLMLSSDRSGVNHVSGRFFSDMATALQKCQEMTYAALGDASGDRKLAGGGLNGDAKGDTAGVHAAVIAALNSCSATPSAASVSLNGQSEAVKRLGSPTEEVV